MSRCPDPLQSQVILIGTSGYEHSHQLPGLPGVGNNLRGLRRVLTEAPTAVFRNCATMAAPRATQSLLARLHHLTATTEDVLFIYYAGHGILNERRELHLAIRTTDLDRIADTAVPFSAFRRAIAGSPARSRILILDCRFSGKAKRAMSAVSAAMDQIDIEDTYILTSTDANRMSRPIAERRYTAFTGELVRLLSADEGRPLTLAELHQRLQIEVTERGLPAPISRVDDTSGDLIVRKTVRDLAEENPVDEPPHALPRPVTSPPPQTATRPTAADALGVLYPAAFLVGCCLCLLGGLTAQLDAPGPLWAIVVVFALIEYAIVHGIVRLRRRRRRPDDR